MIDIILMPRISAPIAHIHQGLLEIMVHGTTTINVCFNQVQ